MDCTRFADGCGKNISTDSIKPLKDSSVSSATTNNHPSVAHPSTYRQTLYVYDLMSKQLFISTATNISLTWETINMSHMVHDDTI